MSEEPSVQTKDAVKDALPASGPKSAGNPVFRMMGLPNFRFRLPSRNWLIFLSVTGSFTTAIVYDRYQKKRAQQRWCNLVSHISKEPLSSKQLPRRITIFLSAPPGDSLRAARDHFHEYVKPVLVAGALDWDVVEGRVEGDVRAGLAERIRKRRRKSGEQMVKDGENGTSGQEEDLIQQLRDNAGIGEWEGLQGDLVLGRNTWKEYIRGLHEGWLGPLDPPSIDRPEPSKVDDDSVSTDQSAIDSSAFPSSSTVSETSDPSEGSETRSSKADEPQTPENQNEKEKPKKLTQERPYIYPPAYPDARPAPSIPESFSPSAVLPFPNLLGFLGTPVRIYRFLNRRYLADDTAREVAALVLANHTQSWDAEMDFTSSADLDASPGSVGVTHGDANAADVIATRPKWGQEDALELEERDWHKSAWQSRPDEGERVWKEQMVIDPRIGERMRRFQLLGEEKEKAERDEGVDASAKGLWANLKEMMGWEEDTNVKGWEHGLVGEESE
ncbi:MAG: hypothetical protein Q9219_004642 [cf. Caloplaca sp. 3 TL-2023]